MNVPNLNQKTLLEILPSVQKQYPEAHIKKTFFGAERIQVPYKKIQFSVRNRMSRTTGKVFDLDFQPPMSWMVMGVAFAVILFIVYSIALGNSRIVISIGSAILAAIVLFVVKAIFKSKNNEEIELFNKHFIIEQFNKNFIDVVINNRKEYN
ncbi:hypothetical protein [Pinibacter aurantiacus]|uniref:Uncharacterized protein n=1 Tax=Pinibacter aurantiacus TaxID=2851599 RepID=A0A9E2S9Q3_9BACT|nr:hypothetical protein [Pinibacter aurantiacus]MBV4358167.1 hypothetical protein [Pinibacter aurantiacus]